MHVCVSMCVCVYMHMHMCVCVPAHYGLKAEAGSVVWNRELTEHGQAFAVAIIIAGFGAAERAGGAASILVLV